VSIAAAALSPGLLTSEAREDHPSTVAVSAAPSHPPEGGAEPRSAVAETGAAVPKRRVPWTGSQFKGSPEPPAPYTVAPAFPHLKFEFPVVLVQPPLTGRLYLGDVRGRIFSFPNDPGCRKADLALDVSKLHPDSSALYGLVFHPDFAKNRYVYVCYVRKNDIADGSVVARFQTSPTDPPVIDPKSEQVILNFWSGGHNGGCLVFGKDGYLYISTGDGAGPSPPDPKMTGQDCSDLLSSILRIDVDHPAPGKAYSVPRDNPFVNQSGVRPEIWSFGFRNPWKMSVDRATGDLWVGDVGWELWELIFKVKRGGNYGWSVTEGPQPVHVEGPRGPTPILPPIKAHPHSEAASITGGYVYRGSRLPPLRGAYIYGDFQTGIIWGLRCQEETVTWHQELARTPLHLVAFGEAQDGELFLVDHDRTHEIYQLVPNPGVSAVQDFPRRLSQTGLFGSTRDHEPAPGVMPYRVNAELWSDGATVERLLAVPGTGQVARDGQGNWRCPEGTVLARTVSLEREPGKPASRRRIETQILHLEAEAWRPYSYVWNDDQTDADLAGFQGETRTIMVDGPGGRHEQKYRVHARAECLLCHNPWVEKRTMLFGIQSASPLGLNAPQMNRRYDLGGSAANQLAALHDAGLVAFNPEPSKLPKLVDPDDESADLDRRARSYLHTNCAHCHQQNAGGTANIALGFELPLEATGTIAVRPIQGTFNIAGAKIIAPSDPARSVLYYRMCKLGGGRMPRIGSSQVDERAVRMIHDWIARMPVSKGGDASDASAGLPPDDRAALEALRQPDHLSPSTRSAAIRRLAETTRGALTLLGLIDHSHASSSLKKEAVSVARDSRSVEVRDLFERFIPAQDRVKRLGDVIDSAAILALSGDAARGRSVFTQNTAAQCKSCHKAGDLGESIGPDLTRIGSKFSKAALLEQILEPSKTIEPAYTNYLLETKDGRVLNGLAVEKTDRAVVLKDAQGKILKVTAGEIERLVPQSRSLMPELLLRDMTAQQVADLLAFLASLR